MLVGEGGLSTLPHPQYITVTKNKLVQWWDQRDSFLQRNDEIDKVRAITGSNRQEFLKYDKKKARLLFKRNVYGIYNIPYYIDLIDQHNNPVVFSDFLRISNHPEYRNIGMSNDVVWNTMKADNKYTTRRSKVNLIRNWWNTAKETYSNLTNLYSAIDSRIKRLAG
jgi:hypothetical protein